ncbi:polysaccharide pyruvyl transferase family protein [Sulfurovum sp. XGS-02]|uniref:polysaccharide pyruvyl transferase family protein n=1 Tax=Sulfurovum sp. XGS-02 TaxID=2925411 RepID=UPI002045E837|nr:polysaccharide pyruvyl transferase family protein [Sulfurovum sp. XGS-02]UPT77165.1 polysaccharide pyruvyl transferase family protein [Sulfurovum sp. XGS-02]
MLKKYKIAILGGYGLGNFGDDALMYILYKKISSIYKSEDIAFICTPEKYLSSIVDDSDIIGFNKINTIQTDLLLYGGGTQFYSFKPKKNILAKILYYIKHPKDFSYRLFSKLAAMNIYNQKNIQNRIAAIGIGVGPFLEDADQSIEQNTKKLFLKMDFVGVRDTYSYEKCKDWGVKDAKLYSDLCFLMDDEYAIENKRSVNTLKKIGIIVRDWDQTDEGAAYYEKIIPLCSELTLKGYEVNIIIFSLKRDLYWCNKLKTNTNVLFWNPNEDNIDTFLKLLDNFDLFITARYHGAIFASLLEKPFIAIGVEQKLELISDLYQNGSEKWLYPFDLHQCLSYVQDIEKNYSSYQTGIRDETIIQKKLARQMLKDFKDHFNLLKETK